MMATALDIGAIGSDTVEASFIPFETEPMEIVFDEACVFDFRALRVEILDAEDPSAST